jgi:imidazolonepropionase-like amidohydrolase
MIRNALDHGVLIDIEVTNGMITAIIPATGGFHAGDFDAEGDEVLPGLWDEHVHIRSWAQLRSRANLLPADDSDAIADLMAAVAPAHALDTAATDARARSDSDAHPNPDAYTSSIRQTKNRPQRRFFSCLLF